MPGGTTTTQNQQQQSQTSPWAPAIPATTGILNQVASNPTAPNASQSDAIAQMQNNARGATNFGAPVAGAAGNLLAGGNPAYSGILTSGLDTLRSNLSPIASGSMIGKNEALQGQLDTIANDVRNSVGSQFAAAGRSLSPSEVQAMARGTMQGEAPVVAAQYNTDVGNQLAANGLLSNAAYTTGTGLNAMDVGNRTAGLQFASAYPGILNANPSALLQAGNLQQELPFLGTGLAESQLLPVASLGAQSTGSGTQTATQQQPLGPTLLGGVLGATSLLGSGGFNVLGPLGTMMMSDARVKEDIKHVGVLNSGDNLYQFHFKNDPARKKHVGVLAQEVEQRHPEDVQEIGGVKHVNYQGVLRRAA